MAQSRASARRVRDDVWDQGRDRSFDDRTLRPRVYPRAAPAETRARAAARHGLESEIVRTGARSGGWDEPADTLTDDRGHIRLGRAPGERADRRPWGAVADPAPAPRPERVERALRSDREDQFREARVRDRTADRDRDRTADRDRELLRDRRERAAADRDVRAERPRRSREVVSWGAVDDMLSLGDDERRSPRAGRTAPASGESRRERPARPRVAEPDPFVDSTDSAFADVADRYAEAADRYARSGTGSDERRDPRSPAEQAVVDYEDAYDDFDDEAYEDDRYEGHDERPQYAGYEEPAAGTEPAYERTPEGRRTVVIRGLGSELDRSVTRAPITGLPHRGGLNPDRIAMWAVLLGVVLIMIAAMSSHA